ncbi:CheR family methyltransferase [Campylobacter canadensis]|uniref:CheR-type methyltransferase domain-containing protein n=1 Tax=Campylobacter canadensis TaxID=449520 RepID=A0ABS7WQC0_9BACT|nr:CheR family methyltransferase [Campylobacter canadensis]MBZ7986948.1 hypothetical protein [Campylobacter canadensis]MBZ7997984.1 hypothetical protein [Campylobacter canadensis]
MFNMFNKNKNNTNNEEKSVEFINNAAEFDSLINKIRIICGIDLEVKKNTISSKLIKFACSNNISSFKELERQIDFNQNLKQELFDLITVCETYFYRELKQLKELIYMIKLNPSLRNILVAPCSSGEEVYSILMLASEEGLFNLNITGIDINTQIIQKAKSATYSKRSLYNLDSYLINKYFDEENDEYKIKKHLFSPTFKVVNVFSKEFLELGKFDIILSRNMMIYFNEEYKFRLVDNFSKMLNFNGLFFAGHADLVPSHSSLHKEYSSSCTYYKKI